MFVKDAKSLCSNLVIVPYNFEAYEEVKKYCEELLPCVLQISYNFQSCYEVQVADQFYEILHTYCNKVQVCYLLLLLCVLHVNLY